MRHFPIEQRDLRAAWATQKLQRHFSIGRQFYFVAMAAAYLQALEQDGSVAEADKVAARAEMYRAQLNSCGG